jgi:hypothetical protein
MVLPKGWNSKSLIYLVYITHTRKTATGFKEDELDIGSKPPRSVERTDILKLKLSSLLPAPP